jgi:BolA protein
MHVGKKEILESKLLGLSPERLALTNESSMHAVPPGSESHWNLIIVSQAFEGLPLVKRHRSVYDTLGKDVMQGIHALTMKTLTPKEWEDAGGVVTNPAPPCRGGSKQKPA